MPKTIFLRVGTEDRIPLSDFITSLRSFLNILQDLDATISRDQRGSMVWEVVSLQKNSPPVVGVEPYKKQTARQDFSEVVEEQFIENTHLLSSKGERNKYLADSPLTKIE